MFRSKAGIIAGVFVAGIAFACYQSPGPNVNNMVSLKVADQNVTGCQTIEPDAEWVNRLVALPERVETVPKSVKDVELQFWGNLNVVTATLYWKAENKYGGTSQRREYVAMGQPEIQDDCTFTVPLY